MQTKLLKLIKYEPVKIAHLLGFKDMTDIHNKWLIEMLFNENDESLQAHRNSYKTTCLSVAIALLIVLKPNKLIMFLRKTDDDVTEVIKQVSNILQTPLIKHIVSTLYGVELVLIKSTGSVIDTNLNTSNKGAPQLLGIGLGGSLTGKHADIIFTDDIVNIKDRISRADRERTKLIYMELQNILNRGGRFFNTGTPWHKDDAFSIMPNIKRFDCYSTGIMSKEQIQEKRTSMTPSLFSANYELKHIADEEALFTNPKFFSDDTLLYEGLGQIDASYGGSDGSAYTIANEKNGNLYVFGLRKDKHIDDCLSEIYKYHKHFRAGTYYLERNADKGYLEKKMRKDNCIVSGYSETMNKFIKISTYLRSNWERIYFHENTDPDYLNEILDYTENATHDDAPDSLASILRQITGKDKWIY